MLSVRQKANVRCSRRTQNRCSSPAGVFGTFGDGARPGFWRNSQPARKFDRALPELPHRKRVETDPSGARIRSQSDAVPVARHASGCQCAQCHIKPVFSNVGQRCQDCHADITSGNWEPIAKPATRSGDGKYRSSKSSSTTTAFR